MQQREREPERGESSDPGADWLTRKIEAKIASGEGPNYEAAQEALRLHDALIAEHGPLDLGDEDVDDIIDGMGLRKNISRDWAVVPWTYWEARGAGPYRR
jgi:hypothetical protein